MKKLKKLAALMLCTAMTFMMCGMVSLAASGELRFSDPSTTVGATVEVTAKLSADEGLGTANATLTYDSTALKFISGENASGSKGEIELKGSGSGDSEIKWTLKFQALSEGTTVINISTVTANTSSGSSVTVTQGSSTITIGEGDPSLIVDDEEETTGGGGEIEIDGETYTVSTDIPEVLIPDGFVKADLSYKGETYAATKQENGELYAIYLMNVEEEEDFWLYDPETETFSPFEQVSISDNRYIVLLSEDMTKELPDNLQKTTMTIEGKEFPAWQNIDASSYYVVYAVNSDGETGFYQYDTVDETYQRYIPETKEEEETSKLGGILNKLRANLDKVILVAWGIFLVMLIILIVLATKLRHRNMELDDLYDEYDIDDDPVPVKKNKADKKSKKADKKAKKSKKKSEDDFYDFDDDDYDEYDDAYEEESYDDEDDYDEYDEYEEEPFKEYDPSDYEDDSDIDDLDELLNARVRVKKKTPQRSSMTTVGPNRGSRRVGHAEADDTFKMDLIDLD